MPNANVRRDFNNLTTDRRCTQCHVWMPETTFNFSFNNSRQRFNAWCKPCVRSYTREQRLNGRTPATGRRFGVEIEFIGSGHALNEAMIAEGLTCSMQQYNHRVSRSSWKIVPDGSVIGGAELVSPVLRGDDGFAQLAKACRALLAAGCTTNKTTGLHVHHDVHDLRVSAFQRLVHNWHHAQPAIDGLVAPSRRQYGSHSHWCQRSTTYDLDSVDSLTTMDRTRAAQTLRGDRYRSLNLQSYGKYGTVEVRQHQGSIDNAKISAWVKFGQAMIDAAVADVNIMMAPPTTASLIDTLPLADATRTYLHLRATRLSAQRTNSMAV